MPPTPSAASSSFVSRGAVLLALTFPHAALAQEEQDQDLSVPDPASEISPPEQPLAPSPAAEAVRPAATERVQITSVGFALPSASLERMLGPALKASFRLRYSSTNHFEPEDLFRERTASPADVHVWVDTTAPRLTRIYFANRDGTRYLVRDLECSKPLDEMDREAIAQTIEWSLQALSEGTAGMTRAEAEALLSEPVEEDSSPTEPEREPAPARKWRRKVDAWLPEVALLHRWAPQSKQLLGAQGPVLRIGADRVSARHQFGVTTSVLYQYPQRHAQGEVALELETLGARLSARYLALGVASGAGLGLRLGLGFDTVFFSPEVLDRARFVAAESNQTIVPLIDTGFVWQQRVEPGVRLEMSLGAEFDLVEVHYDVITPDGTSPLVSKWPVRPTASIGVALF